MDKVLLQYLIRNTCKKGRVLEFGVNPPYSIGAYLYADEGVIGIRHTLITFFYDRGHRFPRIDIVDKCFIKKGVRNDDPRVDEEFMLACDSIMLKESASHLDVLISCCMIGICIDDTTLAIEWGSTNFKSVATSEFCIYRKYHAVIGEYKNIILNRLLSCTNAFHCFDIDDEDFAYRRMDIPSMTPMAARFFIKKALKHNNIDI